MTTISDIPVYKPAVVGSDLLEGQGQFNGESFNTSLNDIDAFVHSDLGWSFHQDSQYTQIAPQTATNQRIKLSCDSLGAISNLEQVPAGVPIGFYNSATNAIEPTAAGDYLGYRITMQATPSNSQVTATLQLQIEDTVPVIIGSSLITFPTSAERLITMETSSFVIANYIANGASLYLEAESGSVSVYDTRILVIRHYKGRT